MEAEPRGGRCGGEPEVAGTPISGELLTTDDRGMSMQPGRSADRPRDAWPSTGWVALLGAPLLMSGFFLLSVAGRDFGPEVYALVLVGASLVTLPVFALALLVCASEAAVGRAWASGFRPLGADERRLPRTAARALRYAGFISAANGGALWFAALSSQV